MTNLKSTKRALVASVLVLALCFSMLVGTTFAWFTDSVTSANNIIQSGNLDIELEYWNGAAWADVKDASDILAGELWEPGYVDVAYLRIKNAGSLALKYQLGINIISETEGKNAEGKAFKLSDYIYYDVKEGVNGQSGAFQDRDAAMAIATEKTKISAGYTKADVLAAKSNYVYLAMVVYMPESVGNDACHNGTDKPKIDLGISIVATQLNSESDSFGPDYDADLKPTVSYVSSYKALKEALANGGEVELMSDITIPADEVITGAMTAPVGLYFDKDTVLDLNGHSIVMKETGDTSAVIATKNAKVDIIGGTIVHEGYSGFAIWARNTSDVVGRGVVNLYDTEIYAEGAEVTVLYADSDQYGYAGYENYGTINVYGGTYTKGDLSSTNPQDYMNVKNHGAGRINIMGGTYNFDLSWMGSVYPGTDDAAFIKVADGYSLINNNDGTWTVMPGANTTLVANGAYYDGASTYYITSAEGLAFVAEEVNKVGQYAANIFDAATIKLENDIDFGGAEIIPIGDFKFSANQFRGTFDGQGHTISNFKISKQTSKSDSNKSSYGLFGNVSGTVKNLTVDSASIKSYAYVGALVGRLLSGGVIENCHVTNSAVECTYWQAGGMIGQQNGQCTVKDCSVVNTTVSGASAIGTLAGPVCSADGDATRTYENCLVKDSAVIKTGSFGGSYDTLFGSLFGYLDITDYDEKTQTELIDTIYINNCKVENTTVNGTLNAPLYDPDPEGIIYIDGVCIQGKTVTFDSASGSLTDTLATLTPGQKLVFPAGEYKVSGTHVIPDGVTVMAEVAGTVTFVQMSTYDNIFACEGDATIKNINFVVNMAGYAICGNTENYDGDGNITVENCNFSVTEGVAKKLWGVYKNLNGDLTVKNCSFDGFFNAVCGINNANDTSTVVSGCTFTNCKEAVGYVSSSVDASFEADLIANNTGLTEDNVIGY